MRVVSKQNQSARNQKRRPLSRQKGLTVIELVTASSILLTLSLGVATFMPAGMKANEKNRKHMVSGQLFNQVMEEVNAVDFDSLSVNGDPASEPAIPSGAQTVVVVDTTPNQVNVNHSGGTTQVNGQTVTLGSGDKAVKYPRYTRINNVEYRVDVKIVKGKYKDLMAARPFAPGADPLGQLGGFLMPDAVAASSGLQINVTPGQDGYKNTTSFAFSTDCGGCPPSNRRVYNWNFGLGEGAGSGDEAPMHTFTQAGTTKPVFLTVTDSQNPNIAITGQVQVNIKDSQVTMSISNTSPKVGEEITYVASCPTSAEADCGPNPVYNWTFGDGTTATGQSVTHTYTEAGQYTPAVSVTGGTHPTASQPLTVTAEGGKQASLVISPSSVGIAGPAESAQTTEFTFSTQSSGYNGKGALSVLYRLDFGDGSAPLELTDNTPDDEQFPTASHKYTTGGAYSVKLTAQPQGLAAGSTDNVTTNTSATVVAKSVVELTANQTVISAGQSVSFSASALGVGNNPQYQWSFGDGSGVTDFSGVAGHTFPVPGVYTVTVMAMGGTNPTASKQITVNPSGMTPGASNIDQSEMKKIYVFVSPWKSSPVQEKDILTTGIYLKGDNK